MHLVVRAQVGDEVIVPNGRALVGGIGELRGQKKDFHGQTSTAFDHAPIELQRLTSHFLPRKTLSPLESLGYHIGP